MPFELKSVVPWGRTLQEYRSMFNLTADELRKNIISFGDGPASFNAEMTALGNTVTSIDPVYRFTQIELKNRISEVREQVLEQAAANRDKFVWGAIPDIDALERIRKGAMNQFLDDLEKGVEENRYVNYSLPEPTSFADLQFDLGLSSHFLILYAGLGLDFHIKAMSEMLRICREIRIFPLLNLNAERSEVLDGILDYFGKEYETEIAVSVYEFQKGGNELLKISNK